MAYRSELMIQVAPELEGPEDIDEIYKWVDSVPLSRMKKNINRDFADGVLVAELVNHYFPTLVEMHNYPAASSLRAKEENWATLNKKVFRKMGFQIHSKDVKGVCSASKGVIERVLCFISEQFQMHKDRVDERAARRETSDASGTAQADQLPSYARDTALRSHKPRESDLADPAPRRVPSERVPAAGYPHRDRNHGLEEQQPTQLHETYTSIPSQSNHSMQERIQRQVDAELLNEKDQTILELRETIVVMSSKIKKLEQLIRIKDKQIDSYQDKLTAWQMGELQINEN